MKRQFFNVLAFILIVTLLVSANTALATTESSQSKEITNITIENNEEFAAIMKLSDPSSPEIADFANSHIDQIVEFDGCVAYIMHHNNYKTRFDVLLVKGDYHEKGPYGAFFAFIDVSFFDMKVDGTDTVARTMGFHIVGKIKEYNEEGNTIVLQPVSLTYRDQ